LRQIEVVFFCHIPDRHEQRGTADTFAGLFIKGFEHGNRVLMGGYDIQNGHIRMDVYVCFFGHDISFAANTANTAKNFYIISMKA
jgi:hypothetical protein